MVALALAVLSPLVVIRLYEIYVGPLSWSVQIVAALVIATIAGIVLHFIFRSTAQNEPHSENESAGDLESPK